MRAQQQTGKPDNLMTPAQTTRARHANVLEDFLIASGYGQSDVGLALLAGADALRELNAGEAVTTHHAEARTHLRQWLAEDAQPSPIEELEALEAWLREPIVARLEPQIRAYVRDRLAALRAREGQ